MPVAKKVGLILLVVVFILLFSSFYIVKEGQQAILLYLGRIVSPPNSERVYTFPPGLHFKFPFINHARKFDVRLQTTFVKSSRILTANQKYVLVDYYIKWRITDVATYYKRTDGIKQRTENLLEQQANDALRAAFGKRTIREVIADERLNIMQLLQQRTNETAKKLGIGVVDFRIISIDLPKEVSDSVFERMRTEREQVAAKHRAAGQANAEKIEATADATATIIVARAKLEAAKIRAQGLRQAANIYAKAYERDPAFYAFYRSLEAYRRTFNNKNDILILQPGDQFFQYFNSVNGKRLAATTRQTNR